jgi:hypothetical protein
MRERDDRQAVINALTQLGEDIKAGRIDQAYDRTTSKFQGQVTRDHWTTVMTSAKSNTMLGDLRSVDSNGLVEFSEDVTGKTAVAAGLFKFEKAPAPMRYTFVFHKAGDTWAIEGIPNLFQSPTPDGSGGPGGPGGPPPSGATGLPPAGEQGPAAPR